MVNLLNGYEQADIAFEEIDSGVYKRTKYRYGLHDTIHNKDEISVYLSGDCKALVENMDGTVNVNFTIIA